MKIKGYLVGEDESFSVEELRWNHYKEEEEVKILERQDQRLQEEEKESVALPKYILSYTRKKKACRIHVRGGCWRKPGIDYKEFEYVYDLEDLAKVTPFCKDCLNAEKAGSSTDSSSSTVSDADTEDETKKEEAQKEEENRKITKMMIANLKKAERPPSKRKRSSGAEEEADSERADLGHDLFGSQEEPL